MTNFTANYNLEPPPSGPIVDKNGVPTVAFLRHIYGIWDRVGSGSGNLIYDSALISQLSSTLLPQLSAIRTELAQEINNKIIFAVNSQLAIQREQPQLSINIVPAQAPENPFGANLAMLGALANVGKSLTLDEVLNNGSVSTHSLSTGVLTVPAGVASTTTATGSIIVTGGVGVSGQVTAATFKGDGSALTNLPAAAPNYQEFVSTAAQTVFNTTINTTAKSGTRAYLQVFVSGVFQQEGATKQFTVTGANQITFNVGLAAGLDVVMYSYS